MSCALASFCCCNKSNLGGEQDYLAYSPSLKEMRAETQAETWSRSHRGMLLTGVLSGSSSVSFLIQLRPNSLGHDTTHSGQGPSFHINHQSRLSLTDMNTGQPDQRKSSFEVPFSQMTLDCVRLTIKTSQHI